VIKKYRSQTRESKNRRGEKNEGNDNYFMGGNVKVVPSLAKITKRQDNLRLQATAREYENLGGRRERGGRVRKIKLGFRRDCMLTQFKEASGWGKYSELGQQPKLKRSVMTDRESKTTGEIF